VIRYAARLIFAKDEHSTNNTTEYEALLLALRKTKALGQQNFIIKTDSKVIQERIEKESEAKNSVLMKYLEKVKEMETHFKGYSVQHIPRDDNNEADKLAKAAARNQAIPPDVFFEIIIIKEPSIKEEKAKIISVVETHDWRAEIMAYLRGHYEPQDELEEKRLKQRARGYAVVNGEVYKSGVTEPWLRCITSKKGIELLKEIHNGFCGAHIGTRALAGKAIKQGFYWPTINVDAKTLVRQSEACQKTTNQKNFTFHASPSNSAIMASAKVGNGSSWTATSSSRKLQICSCRCGQFHEMGGSKTTREHQGTNNSEVLLAKNNLQIWSSERNDC
jgi:ribonuclease HI